MPDRDLPRAPDNRSPDDAGRWLDAALADSYQHVEDALRAVLNLEDGLARITGQGQDAGEAAASGPDRLRERFGRFQHEQARPVTARPRTARSHGDRDSQRAVAAGSAAAMRAVAAESTWDSPLPMFSPRATSSTVQRLILGGHLRRLREIAGMTTGQAAIVIRGSQSKISRMEHGRVGFKERDIIDLLTAYGVGPGDEREALLNLAMESNLPGWWQAYADLLPHWLDPYFGLEQAASFIRVYEAQLVPELLQTDAYADALIRLDSVPSDEEETSLTRIRRSRQEILARVDPPRLMMVIDEAALRRPVGGEAVMREQIRHLIEACENPWVALQILPFSAGAHRATNGSFTILRYAEPDLPDVVYIEERTSALYLDKRTEVDAYLEIMETLCLLANPPAATPAFLRGLLGET